MSFVIDNWYLFVIIISAAVMLYMPTVRSGGVGALSAPQAVQLINREKAVVVDVCGAAEYAAGHVSGAKSVPLDQFQERLPQVVKNKSAPVILVCAHGARARRAAAMARALGYENPQVLAGGLAAWKEANLPIEKG